MADRDAIENALHHEAEGDRKPWELDSYVARTYGHPEDVVTDVLRELVKEGELRVASTGNIRTPIDD